MAGFTFAPQCKIVTPSEPGNIAGDTTLVGPYIPWDDYQHVTVIIGTDATASTTFEINFDQGQDTSGTGTKALAFTRIISTALDGEDYEEFAVISSTYTTVAKTAGNLWIVEFMADNMDVDGGFDHIKLDLQNIETTNGMFTLMIFDQARYKGHLTGLKPVSTFTPSALST